MIPLIRKPAKANQAKVRENKVSENIQLENPKGLANNMSYIM